MGDIPSSFHFVPSFHFVSGKVEILKGQNDIEMGWLNQKIDELVRFALEQDALGIKTKLKDIVSEYQPYEFPHCP